LNDPETIVCGEFAMPVFTICGNCESSVSLNSNSSIDFSFLRGEDEGEIDLPVKKI